MESITIRELKQGDIFSFGPNVWDAKRMFFNASFYNDKTSKWQDNFSEGCRICFWIGYVYDREYRGMFKWSDTNSLDQKVFIPKFPMSNHKRTKDKYCIPNGNQRFIFPYELNDINKGTDYCPNN